MQTKEQLEQFYQTADPWGYKTNDEDARRKQILLEILNRYPKFDKAIDIGAGTQDILFFDRFIRANTFHRFKIKTARKDHQSEK